jgi:hypothetical protein
MGREPTGLGLLHWLCGGLYLTGRAFGAVVRERGKAEVGQVGWDWADGAEEGVWVAVYAGGGGVGQAEAVPEAAVEVGGAEADQAEAAYGAVDADPVAWV